MTRKARPPGYLCRTSTAITANLIITLEYSKRCYIKTRPNITLLIAKLMVGGVMALGSYILGAVVKIPTQVLVSGQPYLNSVPSIEKIIKPNGTEVSGFPALMTVADSALATYYYSYTPDTVGDYIVIIKSTIDSTDYINLDNFTVASQMRSAPRAEPK